MSLIENSLSDVSQDTCLVPRMAKAARCRWWARGAPSACDVCSGGVCVCGRKETRGRRCHRRNPSVRRHQNLCEFCAMDLAPIAKTSPKWLSNSRTLKSQKLSKTLETLKTLKGHYAWSEASPCPRILGWPPLLDGGQKCSRGTELRLSGFGHGKDERF